MKTLPDGFKYFPGYLDKDEQELLLGSIREIVKQAPLYVPKMPKTGKPFSVRMTNCGALGWVSDQEKGYRYQKEHPFTNNPWPDMPKMLVDIWDHVSQSEYRPHACLINFYDPSAKMGMHQDKDEDNLDAPVVSISLGDTCLFRIGQTTRGGPTQSLKLDSGDVVVLSGPSRLRFHGVDKIYPDTSLLLKNGGRINLTLRCVTEDA